MSMLFLTGEPRSGPRPTDVSQQCWAEGKDHPLALLVMLLLMQLRKMLALFADLCLTQTPRFFSAKLLLSWSAPSMYCWLGFFLPRCRSWHFPLLNFIRSLQVHFLSLLTSLWWQHHCQLLLPSSVLHHFVNGDAMWVTVISHVKMVITIHDCLLIHQTPHLIAKSFQVGQAWLPLHKSMLPTPSHILVHTFGNGFQGDFLWTSVCPNFKCSLTSSSSPCPMISYWSQGPGIPGGKTYQ